MTKILLLTLLLPFFCVLQDFHVKRIWLFSKTEYSGNVPRLPGGQSAKGITKKLFCYIEVGKDQLIPQWQTAYFNGISYSVNPAQTSRDSMAVGAENKTKMAIVLKPASGNKIIQLIFNLKPAGTIIKSDGLVLNGTFNNSPVHLKSAEPVIELTPDMMP
jgi:hypothetical protein